MAKDKNNNNAYASSKTTTRSSQRRKYWWNRKKNYEIKKEIKKIMLPGCIFRTSLTN
ncbi:BnaCnng39830D [Brassica napus]|uniref:BnaCnng39830D protein n=2 Tax=Brassica TaxID=3705 RepID=A0A078J9N6_BRANA|nr:BnaCnng39830D [Brassica napus]